MLRIVAFLLLSLANLHLPSWLILVEISLPWLLIHDPLLNWNNVLWVLVTMSGWWLVPVHGCHTRHPHLHVWVASLTESVEVGVRLFHAELGCIFVCQSQVDLMVDAVIIILRIVCEWLWAMLSQCGWAYSRIGGHFRFQVTVFICIYQETWLLGLLLEKSERRVAWLSNVLRWLLTIWMSLTS